MHTISRLLAVAALAAIAAPARADIMHWFWEVEVNGEAVDATRPIPVHAGDQVDIELWAQFDPYRAGFAGSVFAIATDERFHEAGLVNVAEQEGYGRNPLLAELTNAPGEILDVDGNGVPDIIDAIEVFQLPMRWEDNGDWGDPLPVYAIGWAVTRDLVGPARLAHAETTDGLLVSTVYADEYGDSRTYQDDSSVLILVPAPGAATAFAFIALAVARHRDRTSGCGRSGGRSLLQPLRRDSLHE